MATERTATREARLWNMAYRIRPGAENPRKRDIQGRARRSGLKGVYPLATLGLRRTRGLAVAHARAPPQEVLDLLLVAVGLPHAAHHRAQAQVLAEADHRLTGRVLIGEAGCLQATVVEPAPVAQLQQHLRRQPKAGPLERGGGQTGAHGGSTGSARLPSRPITSDRASTPSGATLKMPGRSFATANSSALTTSSTWMN